MYYSSSKSNCVLSGEAFLGDEQKAQTLFIFILFLTFCAAASVSVFCYLIVIIIIIFLFLAGNSYTKIILVLFNVCYDGDEKQQHIT